MKNIWLLSEERPKNDIIQKIVEKFAADRHLDFKVDSKIRILPILQDKTFMFVYEVTGLTCQNVGKIFIKLASGNSSFVDYLLFYEDKEPVLESVPLYAIEETKTDDSESRNTGVYQRCSKFVFVDFYYPGIKKIMLYNLQIPQKPKATETNIFGTRMLLTIGVEIMGKIMENLTMKPFASLKEMVAYKDSMKKAHKGNVPIQISVKSNEISISGKLFKSGGLGHDPNIGALSIIALCIRKWEPSKEILITRHGLKQKHVGNRNKFILIANKLGVKLENLKLPTATIHDHYWHYDSKQEKVGTIFVHLLVENFTSSKSIYENHGGCERGYFIKPNGQAVAIKKYKEGKRGLYKSGDKEAVIHLPDLVIYDNKRKEVLSIEGKTYKNKKAGIAELKNYKYIENKIIKSDYHPTKFVRSVVLYGSTQQKIKEPQIGFLLNERGEIILGKKCPLILKEAVAALFTF